MAAAQSYVLAMLHPDYVRAILPIGGMTAFDPTPRWLFQLMSAAMKSDPVWRKTQRDYYDLPKGQHPHLGMMFGWWILGQSGLSFDYRNTQPWDAVKEEVFYWEPAEGDGAKLQAKASDYDVNDLLHRNRMLDAYDIDDYLHRITAKTLILHVRNDQWLRYEMAEKAAEQIPGAVLLGVDDHPLAHYGIVAAPNLMLNEVNAFLNDIAFPPND